MHGAPSVSYPVGRSSWAAAILAGLWLAGAAAVGGWIATSAFSWRQAGTLAVLLAAGAGAGAAWRAQQSPGRLHWDGAAWCWWPAGGPPVEGGALRVALDLQSVLLVRWSGPARGAWLWLERRADPSCWAALRRAVYSRADPQHALTGAPPPSARP
jgi:toxin CptA